MPDKPAMIEALHPDPAKSSTRVRKDCYDAYRKAILACVPKRAEGVLFGSLPDLVADRLPPSIAAETKPMWWVTTVKLDMEARGLIERVPKASPQRLRRV